MQIHEPLGFTLIELLVAMTVASILVLGLTSLYSQGCTIWQRIEKERKMYNDLRTITETLRQELTSVFVQPEQAAEHDNQQNDPMFILKTSEQIELSFFTLSPSWKAPGSRQKMARVRYVFAEQPDSQRHLLRRYEALSSGTTVIGTEVSDIISNHLDGFSIKVYDPEKEGWFENYEKDKRPVAVRLILQYAEKQFEAVFAIPH